MIIRTQTGAILEVFWRERGSKPWSYITAHRYLSRFRTDPLTFQGARWLLSDRAASGRTWRIPEPVILQRTASLIEAGRVIVAEFGGTERWPGSGFVLGSGSDSALLYWRDKLRLMRDYAQVQDWIQQMQSVIARTNEQLKNKKKISKEDDVALREDKQHIGAFRELIAEAPGVPQFPNLSDSDFLKILSKFFDAGDLLPIYHRYPGIAEPGPPDKPPGPGPGPGPKPNGGDDPDDPDDPFIPGVCLLRASKQGAPFVTLPDEGETT
ncbi:MAG TPA: hypothetical protein VER03_24440 [Bryobacteraceae bacterium]|nr:hypothetical protein [Bryobacteraceae bacterium]